MLNSPLVDSTQPVPPDATTLSPAARIVWTLLIVATLSLCYFSHLGAIGFVGPDEPRYAWIARDMAETGDWVTPRLYGKPWFEKPPLYYWSAAISFKLFGVSETAARLPSAIAALFATLSLAWLALHLYGAEGARWLLLLLPTSVAMIGFSHAASTDMLFSSALTLALVSAAVLLRLLPLNASVVVAQHDAPVPGKISTPTVVPAALFGLSLGLAVLAKGPAAIILLGGALFFWALITKRYRDTFSLLHPAAVAAFCLTALPWYILCARRNPEFFRIFIIEHNFKRYLTPEFQHIQPFWYYAAVLLIALLPWTALFLWSTVTGAVRLWRTREINHATLLLLCWSAFCLLFFSISKSKLPGYILPAIPVVVLLLVRLAWSNDLSSGSGIRWTCWSLSALFFCASLWVGSSRTHGATAYSLQQGLLELILLFLALPGYFLGCSFARHPSRWRLVVFQAAAVLSLLFFVWFGGRRILELEDRHASSRFISRQILSRNIGPDIFVYGLNRSDWYGLKFYLKRDVPELRADQADAHYVVTDLSGFLALEKKHFHLQALELDGSAKSPSLYRLFPLPR